MHESLENFLPFDVTGIGEVNGLYYGKNQSSGEPIMLDRRGTGWHGLIVGKPETGALLCSKLEVFQAWHKYPGDEIMVIDPFGEYEDLREKLQGQKIYLAPHSGVRINPFDVEIGAYDATEWVSMQSDFICAFCEAAIGKNYSLNEIQRSVIDRCVRQLYESYMQKKSAAPTLGDFHDLLMQQPEADARLIAIELEKYCIGSWTPFIGSTNVNFQNRFVVYSLANVDAYACDPEDRDLFETWREVGMQVCFAAIRNRIMRNGQNGIRTWVYLPHLELLATSPFCTHCVQTVWKRSRKQGGILTGISCNSKASFEDQRVMQIMANSSVITVTANQKNNSTAISSTLALTQQEMQYLESNEQTSGLIQANGQTVPFALG